MSPGGVLAGGRRARAAQPGQLAGARARHDLPVAAGLAARERAVGAHHELAGPALDLADHALHPGVHGRAIVAVAHHRVPGALGLHAAGEVKGDRGPGQLAVAVELGVGVLVPGRDRERPLRVGHRIPSPARLMCESHINRSATGSRPGRGGRRRVVSRQSVKLPTCAQGRAQQVSAESIAARAVIAWVCARSRLTEAHAVVGHLRVVHGQFQLPGRLAQVDTVLAGLRHGRHIILTLITGACHAPRHSCRTATRDGAVACQATPVTDRSDLR